MFRGVGQTSITSPVVRSLARSTCRPAYSSLSSTVTVLPSSLHNFRTTSARSISSTSSINEQYNLPADIHATVLHTYSPIPSESVSGNIPIPFPTVRPHEVVVKVHATSVNPIDYEMMTGYGSKAMELFRPLPAVLGRECTGVVVAVGPAVFDFRVGDAVWCTPSPLKSPGCHADYVIATEKELALKPASLSFTEAAALPYAALTAWRALVDVGGVPTVTEVPSAPSVTGIGASLLEKALNCAAQAPGTVSAATDAVAGTTSAASGAAAEAKHDHKHAHKHEQDNAFIRPGSFLAALSPLACLRTVASKFTDSGNAVRRGSFGTTMRPAHPAQPFSSPEAADAASTLTNSTAAAATTVDADAPRVFIHGGSGPLGRFAVQLLRSHGVRVAVSCSAANTSAMRALGAEAVVDYRAHDMNTSVWSDGGKADVVLDCAGGAAMAVLLAGQAKRGGKVVSVYQLLNNLSTSPTSLPVAAAETFADYASIKQELATRFGVEFSYTIFEPNAAALKYISKLVDQGIVTPAIETVVDTSLEGFETFHKRKNGEAYEHKLEDVRSDYVARGGKVVVRMVKE